MRAATRTPATVRNQREAQTARRAIAHVQKAIAELQKLYDASEDWGGRGTWASYRDDLKCWIRDEVDPESGLLPYIETLEA